jgi:Ni/Fe-hydrogenase subunit HybB-like protein
MADVSARGAWASLGSPSWLGLLFILELGFGVFLPAALLSQHSVRKRPLRLGLACLPVLAGVVLNRLTVSWFSMVPYTGPGYIPHWMEIAVSATMLTFLMVIFGLAVRFLPVYPAKTAEAL